MGRLSAIAESRPGMVSAQPAPGAAEPHKKRRLEPRAFWRAAGVRNVKEAKSTYAVL